MDSTIIDGWPITICASADPQDPLSQTLRLEHLRVVQGQWCILVLHFRFSLALTQGNWGAAEPRAASDK